MSARDRWTEKLKCPNCGLTGEARLSQLDGYSYMSDQSTRVDEVPDGFHAVDRPNSNLVDFYCDRCDVVA
jgi:predicted RNA-binding Zn-ribbon protein involved in translation (DUF1610 family)